MDILWVKFVEGPIHANCNLKEVQPTVLPDFVHHSCHPRPTKLGSAPGNHCTYFLHDNAVITRALQAKVLEDGTDLEQG